MISYFGCLVFVGGEPSSKGKALEERNCILDSKIVSESCVDKHIIGRINDDHHICYAWVGIR